MYSSNDFFAMLQNGKTPDEIANELTAALNQAIQEKNTKDAETRSKQRKVDALANILDSVGDYMEVYPELAKHLTIGSAEEIAATLVDYMDETYDELVKELDALQKLTEMLDKHSTQTAPKTADPIASFLKANHLS